MTLTYNDKHIIETSGIKDLLTNMAWSHSQYSVLLSSETNYFIKSENQKDLGRAENCKFHHQDSAYIFLQ